MDILRNQNLKYKFCEGSYRLHAILIEMGYIRKLFCFALFTNSAGGITAGMGVNDVLNYISLL